MAALLSLLSLLSLSAPQPQPERMGTHGMVLFGGGEETFLSHIPMFHRPHDLQLVMAVQLAHPSWSSAPSFSEEGHTFVPEKLDLTELAEGRLTAFTGTVFRGNFEADGQPLFKDVTVTVKRLLVREWLPQEAKAPQGAAYWLVGSKRRAFLVHVITAPPDFDQIVLAQLPGVVWPRTGAARRVMLPRPLVVADGPATARLEGKGIQVKPLRELSHLVGPDFVPAAPPAGAR
jgi:hypothetical protein